MIPRALFAAALVLPLALGPGPAVAQDASALSVPARQIVVTGTGEAGATPDRATTSLTVLETATTARSALDGSSRKMAEVIAAMKELGIEPKDLQTSGFSIAPQFRYDSNQNGTQAPPVLVAYEVRNTLSVRLRDVAKVGVILDKAVTLGVNQGGEVSFTLSDPAPVLSEARRRAVEDAMATARTLASAAGVSLGPIRSISTSDGDARPEPAAGLALRAAPADKSVPIEAGESTIRAEVRMVFEIAGALK